MPIPVDGILIDQFIFHVVHHGEEQPILLDETPITGFEVFFKRRISEILNGNKFFFNQDSSFVKEIKSIDEGSKSFLDVSKELAKQLHVHQDNRIKPGVMILISSRINTERRYILIKYDHENVIYYTYENNKALLQEMSNTFSKSKDALQKSVVIDSTASNPYGIVIDKSERQHVTQFFKNYLGIKRVYDNPELTEKVRTSYVNLVRQFKSELPKEYTSQLAANFYHTVKAVPNFEPSLFLKAVTGQYYKEEMNQVFHRELKRNDILGEEFEFDKNIPKPRSKKYRTAEGVAIQYPVDADDTVVIKHSDTKTIITITTEKLIEE